MPAQNLSYPQQPQYYSQPPPLVYGGHVPYYPMAMGYPDYMYQQYQYYAMANQYGTPLPYMNMGMNGYTPRKKHNKNQYGQNSYSGSGNGYAKQSQWSSNSNSSTTPTEATPSPPDSTEVSKVEDTSKDEALPAEAAVPEEATAEETKSNSLPVLFNTSLDDFLASKKEAAGTYEKLLASKDSHLSLFFTKEVGDVVFNEHAVARVIDHNSDKAYLKRIYQNPDQGPKTNDNDTYDSASLQKTPTSNWASFLQTTAKKVPKKGQQTRTANLLSGAPSTPGLQPSIASPSVSSTQPQPLGALAVKMLFDPDFNLDDIEPFTVKPRGLTNSGNICYMNAVLQCLIFCLPFNKMLRLIHDRAIGNIGEKSPTPLIDATIQFINDFMTYPPLSKPNGSVVNSDGIVVGRPLSPEGLYMKLIENTKFQHLKWGQQEDAEEFLGYFLDGLHEEFVKAESTITSGQMDVYYQELSRNLDSVLSAELKSRMKEAVRLVNSSEQKQVEVSEDEDEEGQGDANGWSEVGSGKRVSKKRVVEVEPSPITMIFGGQFRSVLTIPKSKELQSITVDPFRAILVDISHGDVATIEDALWKFNEAEKLLYKVEEDREVIARKQTFIDELPQVLVIQLKRFSYQHEQSQATVGNHTDEDADTESIRGVGVIEKVMKDIKFGLDLTIPAECLSPAVRFTQQRDYHLIGAIYHHGRNAEGGHYTCDVNRDGQNWLRIDDTAVESIDASSVTEKPASGDKSAYILVYERNTR